MEKSSGHKNSPDSQHTYWRDSGCLPAETASRTCNCFTRSNFGDTRYLSKPPPRCIQWQDTAVAKGTDAV